MSKRAIVDLSSLPTSRTEARRVGNKYYFTNEPCKNGHLVHRCTANSSCVQCVRDRQNKLRADNPEKIRKQQRDNYVVKGDSVRTRKKKDRLLNLDHYRAKDRESNHRRKSKLAIHYKIPRVKLARNMRSRLYNAMKKGQKTGSAVDDLGCSINWFMDYLEWHFEEGMD